MESNSTGLFLKGWRTLPEELKLQVLEHIVPKNQVYRAIGFSKGLDPKLYLKGHGHDFDFDRLVFPLLCCPEIATMVKEIFYGQNVMLIRNVPVAPSLRYPPKANNSYVRHLRIVLDFKPQDLEFIYKFSQGFLGFGELRNVEIRMNNKHMWNQNDADKLAKMIVELPSMTISSLYLDLQIQYYYIQSQANHEKSITEGRVNMFRHLLHKINIAGPAKESYNEKRYSNFDEGDIAELIMMSKQCKKEN